MILISHRGNINGKNTERENSPTYIIEAIEQGFDVEVDVWFENQKFWLGHDFPQYEISYEFLLNDNLWCHAKNMLALLEMKKHKIHFFWHEDDEFTLTSKNFIWSFPTKENKPGTISVLPEINNQPIQDCVGICSDFISNYK